MSKLSPGMQKFMDDLPNKIYDAVSIPSGDIVKVIDCEICEDQIQVVGELNVFTYNNPPEYTTKALCKRCLKQEVIKNNIPIRN